MDGQQVTTMANKFQSVLDADVLHERGKQLGFAKRKRLITPFRLGLSLMAAMATQQVPTIAGLHRQFNGLWQMETDYNAFHKQLDKSTAPVFFLASLSNIMSQPTMKALGFEAGKAFSECHRLLPSRWQFICSAQRTRPYLSWPFSYSQPGCGRTALYAGFASRCPHHDCPEPRHRFRARLPTRARESTG